MSVGGCQHRVAARPSAWHAGLARRQQAGQHAVCAEQSRGNMTAALLSRCAAGGSNTCGSVKQQQVQQQAANESPLAPAGVAVGI
jgi:hypothetical protein